MAFVILREGEPFEAMLTRFKKAEREDGTRNSRKRRRFFQSPSEVRSLRRKMKLKLSRRTSAKNA